MSISNHQLAEAIFEKVFEGIAYTEADIANRPQAEMLNRLFRHIQVEKIREVLEGCAR